MNFLETVSLKNALKSHVSSLMVNTYVKKYTLNKLQVISFYLRKHLGENFQVVLTHLNMH